MSEAEKPKRRVGRPRKILDEKRIFELASIMCSYQMIASNFGVDEDTIRNNYSAVVEAGRQEGKKRLLEEAFRRAKGSDKIFTRLMDEYIFETNKHRSINNVISLQQQQLQVAGVTKEQLIRALALDKFIQSDVVKELEHINGSNGAAVTDPFGIQQQQIEGVPAGAADDGSSDNTTKQGIDIDDEPRGCTDGDADGSDDDY